MTQQGERATPRRRRTRRKVFHESPGLKRLGYGGEDVIVLVSSFATTEPLVSGWTRVVGRLLAQGILEWSQAIPKIVREQAYRQRVSRASPPVSRAATAGHPLPTLVRNGALAAQPRGRT